MRNYLTNMILLIIIIGLGSTGFAGKIDFPILEGQYLGQELPGSEPKLFAPDILSDGTGNRDFTITSDGKEIYTTVHTSSFSYATILITKMNDLGIWNKPEVVSFAKDPRYIFIEPALSYDGKKLFFMSTMPKNEESSEPSDEDIWYVERNKLGDEWSNPINIGTPVNSDGREFFPSLTKDNTIYFTRALKGEREENIYRCKFVNGKYLEAEKLSKQVNIGTMRFNAFVASDESYIIVPALGMKDGLGGVDYYIVFRNEKDDTWQEPINMGSKINSATGQEWSLSVTPDNKYIFYMASKNPPKEFNPKQLSYDFFKDNISKAQNGNPDIYWIDSGIIDELKKKTR